jgi:hypothetical protein
MPGKSKPKLWLIGAVIAFAAIASNPRAANITFDKIHRRRIRWPVVIIGFGTAACLPRLKHPERDPHKPDDRSKANQFRKRRDHDAIHKKTGLIGVSRCC